MKKNIIILLTFIAALTTTACKKEYDSPTITYPEAGETVTLDSLISMFEGYPIKFETNFSVYATVTMDEVDGNIYKNVYIQDGDVAINMRMKSSGGLYVGDSIRIDMEGVYLNRYNGAMQLDSVDVDKNVFILETDKDIQPTEITLSDLTTNLESRLVKINDIQFIAPDTKSTYADADNLASYDLIIEDEDGNTAIVRNSGYSNFASEEVADGSGSITAIVGVYNGTIQLYIRSFNEILLDNARFKGIQYLKNFDDGVIESDGWTQYSVTGPEVIWETSSAGGADTDYGVISNYINSTNIACENWLISPAYDLTELTAPALVFQNAYSYTGTALALYVSTDYDGTSDPNTQGTWVDITPMANWSSGNFAWVSSGNINISAYISANTTFAFKYEGSASGGSTWEVEDIKIIG